MKKKILMLLALCFMLPISLVLTACGGIKQPPQEEMHAIFTQAQENWKNYEGSWSLNGTVKVVLTRDGQELGNDDVAFLQTYNSETKEYVNFEKVEGEVDHFTVVKKLPNGTFESWSDNNYKNKIVDASYVEKEYTKEYLEILPSGLKKTYEDICADLEEDETELRNSYSQDGYSCNEVTFKLTYEKISDSEYQCVLYQLRDYYEPESSGKKERTRSLTEYTYTFDVNGLNSVSMDYEYHVWTFNASTNEQIGYGAEVQDANYTFAKSYDTTAMGKVDLTGKTAPTQKIQQQLNVYLDGELKYSESVDFGTDIDTVISTITPKENCTIGNKYLDKDFTQCYISGMKTSSTKATNVYCVSAPNEGYALICNKYYNAQSELVSQKWNLYVAGQTIELDPVYDDYVYDVVKKNGEVVSEKTVALESENVYFYEFYATAVSETCDEVQVYVNGNFAKSFSMSRRANASVFAFIQDYRNNIEYHEIDIAEFDYEVYLDEACTQKVDNFSMLGSGIVKIYFTIEIPSTHIIVTYEDKFSNDIWSDYMEVSLFNEYYGYNMEFNGYVDLTINGVDASVSPYVTDTGAGYVVTLVGGQEYHIIIE